MVVIGNIEDNNIVNFDIEIYLELKFNFNIKVIEIDLNKNLKQYL